MKIEYQDDLNFSDIWNLYDGFLNMDGWPVNPMQLCLLADGSIALRHDDQWNLCKIREGEPSTWFLYPVDRLPSRILLDIDFPRHSTDTMLRHLAWLDSVAEPVSSAIATDWKSQGF